MVCHGSHAPVSHCGQSCLSAAVTSLLSIAQPPQTACIWTLSCEDFFFFPLNSHLLVFLQTFLLPPLLLRSSSVCIFAASSGFNVCSNRKKAGKWEIVGGTSSGWDSPDREWVAHSLCTKKWQPCPTLSTAGASQAPFSMPHPLLPVSCGALGLCLWVRPGDPPSESSCPVPCPNREQAWPMELPQHHLWHVCFYRAEWDRVTCRVSFFFFFFFVITLMLFNYSCLHFPPPPVFKSDLGLLSSWSTEKTLRHW